MSCQQSQVSECSYVTQAITANFAPLLFVMFHRQYGIPLSSLALIPAIFYIVQLCVDFLCAKFSGIDYRRSIILSEVTSAAVLRLLGERRKKRGFPPLRR